MLFCLGETLLEIFEYANFDLSNIVTPVKVRTYKKLLKEVGYDHNKTKYLVHGFSQGFSLHYEGPLQRVTRSAKNLPITVGSKEELWNKVMVEVKANRYAGPFEKVPFKYYVQSPIGLVPKDKGRKTRLIFQLSYPKTGDSVNFGIPEEYCSVKYPDFFDAVKLCIAAGQGCHMPKSDMSMAFRNIPIWIKSLGST